MKLHGTHRNHRLNGRTNFFLLAGSLCTEFLEYETFPRRACKAFGVINVVCEIEGIEVV